MSHRHSSPELEALMVQGDPWTRGPLPARPLPEVLEPCDEMCQGCERFDTPSCYRHMSARQEVKDA